MPYGVTIKLILTKRNNNLDLYQAGWSKMYNYNSDSIRHLARLT